MLLVESLDVEDVVAFETDVLVAFVEVGQAGKAGTRDLSKGMEVETVDGEEDEVCGGKSNDDKQHRQEGDMLYVVGESATEHE